MLKVVIAHWMMKLEIKKRDISYERQHTNKASTQDCEGISENKRIELRHRERISHSHVAHASVTHHTKSICLWQTQQVQTLNVNVSAFPEINCFLSHVISSTSGRTALRPQWHYALHGGGVPGVSSQNLLTTIAIDCIRARQIQARGMGNLRWMFYNLFLTYGFFELQICIIRHCKDRWEKRLTRSSRPPTVERLQVMLYNGW